MVSLLVCACAFSCDHSFLRAFVRSFARLFFRSLARSLVGWYVLSFVPLDVKFCKDHRDKIEVPDPLAVEDLISSKLNNKRKLAKMITQYRDIFFISPYTV